ncbi:MAG: hypothetical protein V1921_01620 [Candidatus Altiarchaeota archaeon]
MPVRRREEEQTSSSMLLPLVLVLLILAYYTTGINYSIAADDNANQAGCASGIENCDTGGAGGTCNTADCVTAYGFNCDADGLFESGNQYCCGDDSSESYKASTAAVNVSSYSDDTDACCDTSTDCCDNNACTANNAAKDITGATGTDDDAFCSSSTWIDCDTSSTTCTACDTAGSYPCTGAGCWIVGGESAAFGEYDSGTATECCGDDTNEFFITDSVDAGACCNLVTDCESGGTCYALLESMPGGRICGSYGGGGGDGGCAEVYDNTATSGTTVNTEDSTCNCDATGSDGAAPNICDSDQDETADGICVDNDGDGGGTTFSCDANEVCDDGTYFADDCGDCASEVQCDSNVNSGGTPYQFLADGMCGEADADDTGDDCLTGAACRDSEDSNHLNEGCECATAITDWDPYDSDGGTTFSANGICIGSTADTSGEACQSGSNYYNDCSSCSSGDACDMDITNGAYSADGTCYSDSCVLAGGEVVSGEYGTGVTGGTAITFDSGNENADCDAVTDQGLGCDRDESGGATAEGICADGACEVSLVSCDCVAGTACATTDMTDAKCANSCTAGKACDSDVGSNGFEQDGICENDGTVSCDTSGHVVFSGTSTYYAACADVGGGDSGHACDGTLTAGSFLQAGICTDGTACTTSGAAYESDNATATVDSLKAGCTVNGAPCISDVTALSGTADESDFNGICISDVCDTNVVAWNNATGWSGSCASVEGYWCEAQGAGDTDRLFDEEGYCVDDQSATIICCGDDSGEDIASGETADPADVGLDAECGCSSDTDENICHSDANGTFTPDGICAKDATNAWDCDVNEVCDDGTDTRADCAQCDSLDSCWSDVNGSAYDTYKNGVCSGSDCCTQFIRGSTTTNLDACGIEATVCGAGFGGKYCDDISDGTVSWGDTEETNKYRCDESETQCILCGNDNAEAAGSGNLTGTNGECDAACGAPTACDDLDSGTVSGSACCYTPSGGDCSSQTCMCTEATLLDSNDTCCYNPTDYCSATTGCTNTTETCRDFCVNDNDGGDCTQSRTDPTNNDTCYHSESCSDSGCAYSSSATLSANTCDYCSATGKVSGDNAPALSSTCDSTSHCPNSGTRYWDETTSRADDCWGLNGTTKINTENYQTGYICADQTVACSCNNAECRYDCQESGYGRGTCTSGVCECNSPPTLGVITSSDDVTPTYNASTIVRCNVTVTDVDGYDDVAVGGAVRGVIWHSTSTFGSVDELQTHYSNSSCGQLANDGLNSINYSCTFYLRWYANPGEWTCAINVSDRFSSNVSNSKEDITIASFKGIGAQNTLAFGTMGPGDVTALGREASLQVTNQGTTEADVQLSVGGDLYCAVGTIPSSNIHYDTSSKAYASMCAMGSSCPAVEEQFDLRTRNSADTSDPSETLYFGIHIPIGVSGTCTTSVTVTQV